MDPGSALGYYLLNGSLLPGQLNVSREREKEEERQSDRQPLGDRQGWKIKRRTDIEQLTERKREGLAESK